MDADTPMRRLIVAVDVHRYSRRDPLAQVDAQKALIEALDHAAAKAGLDRTAWHRQSQGDGELAILPADVDEALVVADFVEELTKRLRRQNRQLRRETRLRMRAAIHSGVLSMGANGYAGPGPVETCRLLDAAPLKDALAAADDADLAVIVSDRLYRDIVEPGFRGLQPKQFWPVRVIVKEYDGTGYITVPGQEPARTSGELPAVTPAPPPTPPPPQPAGGPPAASTHITVTSNGSGDAFAGDKNITKTYYGVGDHGRRRR
ncbi:MAG TPA: hypothetical protein VF069_09475 [Streptosporangiaceae bacterium]